MPSNSATALGLRIETARRAAGLSRRELCTRSGVSVSMIRKTESGERTPSDNVLDALAHALGTTPDDLHGGPRRTDSRVHLTIPHLQGAIASYDDPDDGPVRPICQLDAAVAAMTADRVNSRYLQIAEQAPALLEELTRALAQAGPGDRPRTAQLLALAARSADAVAYKTGYHNLSARLVDLMRWATQQAGSPALTATAAYVRTETYLAADRLPAGLRALQAAADQAGTPHTTAAAAAAAALHMRAAVVAGRIRDGAAARDHLQHAAQFATTVPEQVYLGTAVGPDSLQIHRLAVAVELGDDRGLHDAVDGATRWAPPRDLSAERRSHYYIDLARAQMALRRPQHALESLQAARAIAPQHVREHGQVRAELATMVRLSGARDQALIAYARWARAV